MQQTSGGSVGRTIDDGARMKAVTIHDARGDTLAFDLIDILETIGPTAESSTWECRGVEATGPGAIRLHDASDTGAAIPGRDLLVAARDALQVIDGDFLARRVGQTEPWASVRAVDSSVYVLISDDVGLLRRVRQRFRDVRESPQDAWSAE